MRVTGLPWAAKRKTELAHYALRRRVFMARIRVHAFWQRSTIELDLSPDVKLGREVRATIEPRTHNGIRIGPNCSIGDRMLFVLGGGQIELGDWVEFRRDTVLTVAGHLVVEGKNILQPGIAIHCDESVIIRRMAGIGERTTIVDSSHYFTGPDDWMGDNLKTGPIEICYNAWLGAKVTVARNVTIGHHAVVAANALVVDDVPPGYLASGVPAAAVRRIVPWLDDDSPASSERLTD
jgi:acetyltransferase-like isoleucine patch superfamily enzyme